MTIVLFYLKHCIQMLTFNKLSHKTAYARNISLLPIPIMNTSRKCETCLQKKDGKQKSFGM